MPNSVIQTSFASGEIAPSLYARVDLGKYHSGAALMRNFFVDYRSGASTRPGTKFIIYCFNALKPTRLIPFQYSVITNYVIEFGDLYCRFINNGASVLEAAFAVTGALNTNPVQLNIPGHNFAIADWIFVAGLGGMTGLNNNFYAVSNVVGNLVSLQRITGSGVNGTSLPAYTAGGTASRVYKIDSPYAATDLALLKFAQSANVMTLTHPSYPPYDLTLITPTNWTFTQNVFGTTVLPPTNVVGTPSAVGTTRYAYIVTSVDVNGQESLASVVANVAAAVDVTRNAGTITLSWTAASGATEYNVYKAEIQFAAAPVPTGSAFGFIGKVAGTSFIDSNIVPDFASTPPVHDNPFVAGNNPGVVCYFQQRRAYAGSNAFPLTLNLSQPGFFNNFNGSDPVQDGDAITATLVSKEVNAIKHMLPMPGGLIVLTSKGAWQVNGGQGSNAVTPANINATPQAYNGASDLPPIVVNFDILYGQAKGSYIRDLSFNLYANIYTGTDISVLSNHLFFGYQIPEWAYAEEPFKIVWAVRNDGAMLSLTFLKEQEIYGWAHHDTYGQFKSVATVTEGQVDAVYVVCRRFINGLTVQTIERFAERQFAYGAEDAWCVDCGLQSGLPLPASGLTPLASSGTTTFGGDFSMAAVGDVIRAGGGIAVISNVNAPTNVTATWIKSLTATIPNDPLNRPLPIFQGEWSLSHPSTVFTGLDHLEGETVSILADGGVVAPQVVVNGSITLQNPATKVTVGFAFTPQLQTLKLDLGEPTVQGKRKKIPAVTARCDNTRGLSVGMTFNTLVDIKELNPNVPVGSPIPLISDDVRVLLDPLWNIPGQVCFQQNDPLPATILGVIPEVVVGDSSK